jgi:hypothetical protein
MDQGATATAVSEYSFCGQDASRASGPETTTIPFVGDPQGGHLTLVVNRVAIMVETSPHDALGNVVRRLSSAVNQNPELVKHGISASVEGDDDNTVVLRNAAAWAAQCCSNDPGIPCPEPPQDLVCSLSQDRQIVSFSWMLPGGGYDKIHIVESGIPVAERMRGNVSSYQHNIADSAWLHHRGKLVFTVFGVTNGVPGCSSKCEVVLHIE